METLTKAWWLARCGGRPRQRTVAEMREHRRRYGTGGNCFDLAVWLICELADAGVSARAIGHDLETHDAHIAVLAQSGGDRFLCDLGDQWLQPIGIGTAVAAFASDWHAGFFPGATVRTVSGERDLRVHYRFPNGHEMEQAYDLAVVDGRALERACQHSQGLLRYPLVEMAGTDPETGESGAWEFDRYRSFWRLPSGRRLEPPCASREEWAARIVGRTAMAAEVIEAALEMYAARGTSA